MKHGQRATGIFKDLCQPTTKLCTVTLHEGSLSALMRYPLIAVNLTDGAISNESVQQNCRCVCENILFYIPVSGSSNLELYRPLVTSLASRGHRVTWVTSLRQPEPVPGSA